MSVVKILFTLIFLTITTPVLAQYQFVQVVDGDTVRANGRLVRIVGLNTPELRGKCPYERNLAMRASNRLSELVADGVILEEVNRRDRYGRLLAIVRNTRGQDVAHVLISEGLAEAYNGRGRRRDWCNIP